MTGIRQLAHFDTETVSEARMLLCDLRGFLETVGHQFYVTAYRLLGFSKGPVDHTLPARPRDDASLEFERLTLHRLSLRSQAVIPRIPAAHQLLSLLRRKVLVVFGTGIAKKEHIGNWICFHGETRQSWLE